MKWIGKFSGPNVIKWIIQSCQSWSTLNPHKTKAEPLHFQLDGIPHIQPLPFNATQPYLCYYIFSRKNSNPGCLHRSRNAGFVKGFLHLNFSGKALNTHRPTWRIHPHTWRIHPSTWEVAFVKGGLQKDGFLQENQSFHKPFGWSSFSQSFSFAPRRSWISFRQRSIMACASKGFRSLLFNFDQAADKACRETAGDFTA